jgi:hypothetical protein
MTNYPSTSTTAVFMRALSIASIISMVLHLLYTMAYVYLDPAVAEKHHVALKSVEMCRSAYELQLVTLCQDRLAWAESSYVVNVARVVIQDHVRHATDLMELASGAWGWCGSDTLCRFNVNRVFDCVVSSMYLALPLAILATFLLCVVVVKTIPSSAALVWGRGWEGTNRYRTDKRSALGTASLPELDTGLCDDYRCDTSEGHNFGQNSTQCLERNIDYGLGVGDNCWLNYESITQKPNQSYHGQGTVRVRGSKVKHIVNADQLLIIRPPTSQLSPRTTPEAAALSMKRGTNSGCTRVNP